MFIKKPLPEKHPQPSRPERNVLDAWKKNDRRLHGALWLLSAPRIPSYLHWILAQTDTSAFLERSAFKAPGFFLGGEVGGRLKKKQEMELNSSGKHS